MNKLVLFFLYAVKMLYYWTIILPFRYSIISLMFYPGLMYLFFGTTSMNDIQYRIFKDDLLAQYFVFAFFGLPFLVAGFSIIGRYVGGSSLDGVIHYRNQKMKYATPEKAYEIMKKTSHLDVIKSNPYFNNALVGFKNTNRNAGPTRVYEGLVNKK